MYISTISQDQVCTVFVTKSEGVIQIQSGVWASFRSHKRGFRFQYRNTLENNLVDAIQSRVADIWCEIKARVHEIRALENDIVNVNHGNEDSDEAADLLMDFMVKRKHHERQISKLLDITSITFDHTYSYTVMTFEVPFDALTQIPFLNARLYVSKSKKIDEDVNQKVSHSPKQDVKTRIKTVKDTWLMAEVYDSSIVAYNELCASLINKNDASSWMSHIKHPDDNEQEIRRLYRLAAEQGNSLARALMTIRTGEYKSGTKALRKYATQNPRVLYHLAKARVAANKNALEAQKELIFMAVNKGDLLSHVTLGIMGHNDFLCMAAKLRHPLAICAVSLKHMRGVDGFAKSLEQARDMLLTIPENHMANFLLGDIYSNFGDDTNAKKWYMSGAFKGHTVAQFRFGEILRKASCTKESFIMQSMSAAKNCKESLHAIGCDYLQGDIVKQNVSKGLDFICKSADLDCNAAHLLLGCLNSNGWHLALNMSKAFVHYSKAAQLGSPDGMFHLANLYESGRGTGEGIHHEKALEWMQRAASLEHAQAEFTMGIWYEFGYGIPKDMVKSTQYFKSATMHGHPTAFGRWSKLKHPNLLRYRTQMY